MGAYSCEDGVACPTLDELGRRAAGHAAGDAEQSAETAVAQTPRFVVQEVGMDGWMDDHGWMTMDG